MKFAEVAAVYIHDVKNRLLELVASAQSRGERETLDIALSASEALTNLLALYKSEQGALALDPEASSPGDLLTELAEGWRPVARARIDVAAADAPPFWFYDEAMVRLALTNALHNALRHATGRVVLRAAERGDELEFSVSDDGSGFPEAMLRAPPGTIAPASRSGTGLGLYLGAMIAAAHENQGQRGRIQLANDGGAVFRLFLPR